MSTLAQCVVCGSAVSERVFAVASTPIHPFRPPAALGLAPGFGALDIVACAGCGHLYNAAFELDRVDELYAAMVLTNTPVSDAMVANLEATADYLLSRAPDWPIVADIGGGTGILARAVARRAREVHLVEPSRALRPEDFAGTGVVLHQSVFPAPTLGERAFDVIIARQVLEHIPDPMPFLRALRQRLQPEGLAYIEIPSAEYIEDARSVVDFHYPHVHYYRRGAIETLLARAGFDVIEVVDVKAGHDRGFLLGASTPRENAGARPAGGRGSLAAGLAAQVSRGRERLRAIGGRVALYGANAYSQALLALYPAEATYSVMFDDTMMYEGQYAYGPGLDLRIELPSSDALSAVDAVVITAYLHDVGIATKIRQFGFRGPVYTVRANAAADNGTVPEGLFCAGYAGSVGGR